MDKLEAVMHETRLEDAQALIKRVQREANNPYLDTLLQEANGRLNGARLHLRRISVSFTPTDVSVGDTVTVSWGDTNDDTRRGRVLAKREGKDALCDAIEISGIDGWLVYNTILNVEKVR